jgi:hypothetical protein
MCEIVNNVMLFNENYENRILNILSGVEVIIISVLNGYMVSTGKKICIWYKNLAFEQNTCSVLERNSIVSLAIELQSILC